MDWGVDEVLLAAPQNRLRVTPEAASPVIVPPRAAPLPVSALPAGPADATKIAANCTNMEDLREALANFTGCVLRDTATQLVFADGAAEARVMLIGDAPAAEDDRSGRPFSGPRGQLLDKMLASIGLDRSLVRITNIVPWRPPADRGGNCALFAVFTAPHRFITAGLLNIIGSGGGQGYVACAIRSCRHQQAAGEMAKHRNTRRTSACAVPANLSSSLLAAHASGKARFVA